MNGYFVLVSEEAIYPDVQAYPNLQDFTVSLGDNDKNIIQLANNFKELIKDKLLDIYKLDTFLAAFNHEEVNPGDLLIFVPEEKAIDLNLEKYYLDLS